MASVVWPVNTESYTPQEWRQTQSPMIGGATAARPLGARSGVRPGTPTSTVGLDNATTYRVKPHAGVLDLATGATTGPYFYAIDADVTGTVVAAEAIIRKDILWVRLDDPSNADGSSTPAAALGYTKGTVASTPPVTPARSMRIATITVPVSGGGPPTIVWDAPYAVGAGGIVPTRNDTERTALLASASAECPIVTDCLDSPGTLLRSTGGAFERMGTRMVVQNSLTGAAMPATATPMIQAFPIEAATDGAGSINITFPEAFAVAPVVHGFTVNGTGVAVIIPSNVVTATGCRLNWPGVVGVQVRAHITAIGWRP